MSEKNQKKLLVRISDLQQKKIEILKTKEAYGYNYAPLEDIIPILVPILKEHGIGYVHTTGYDVDSKQNYLETKLFSLDDVTDCLVSRTNINSEVSLANMNKFMVLGSAMTYFRRYHLVVMCGLITDEDSDAGGGKPSKDQLKKKPVGRSVEAASTKNSDLDYVAIFKNLIDKKKDKTCITNTFNTYKGSMSKEDVEAVSKLIDENYK